MKAKECKEFWQQMYDQAPVVDFFNKWNAQDKEVKSILETETYHYILTHMLELSADHNTQTDKESAIGIIMSMMYYVAKSYEYKTVEGQEFSPAAELFYAAQKKFRDMDKVRNIHRVCIDIQKTVFDVGFERCGVSSLQPFCEWLKFYGYELQDAPEMFAE